MRPTSDSDRPITQKERSRLALVLCALAGITLATAPAGCDLQPTPIHADAWEATPPHADAGAHVPAAQVMKKALKIIGQMEADYPNVEPPELVWAPCDQENGFYQGSRITICAEDLEHPDWVIQVAAHEFGHAVTDQLASITDENAADEIAIIAMADHGWWDEMLGSAEYMKQNWPQDHMSGDEHPGGAYRAWELVCAEAGAEALKDPTRPNADCEAFYRGLVMKWDRRIPRAKPDPRPDI